MITFLQVILFLVMILLSLFMILIILLQRGKGGGLVGAFGGLGGNSAFGTKTGDVFLKITIVCAIVWFVFNIGGRYVLRLQSNSSLVSGTHTAAQVDQTQAVPAAAATPADAAPAAAAPAPAAAAPADAAPADAAPADAPAEN